MSTLLIQNAHIINYNEEFFSDVLVEDGIITKIAKNIPLCCDEESIEASNFLVFPAGIDPHVHMQLPTPAGASCDDFANGSKAAFAIATTTKAARERGKVPHRGELHLWLGSLGGSKRCLCLLFPRLRTYLRLFTRSLHG